MHDFLDDDALKYTKNEQYEAKRNRAKQAAIDKGVNDGKDYTDLVSTPRLSRN